MKNSRQRELILEYAGKSGLHPSAEEIHEEVKKYGIALGTVYRNLGKMVSEGLIKKLEGISSSALYDMNPLPHYHMVCRQCGFITDIPESAGEGIIEKAISHIGAEIDSCNIVFHGLCKKCSAHNKKGGKIL
ncbi:MAG: transcriptional repressor [bacterium]|nr:transcriptional repressor [bacterium]